MQNKSRLWTGVIGVIGLTFLILDAKTAISGAINGIELCINTIIPSLLPFFVFSTLLNSALNGIKVPVFKPLCKLLGIPTGAESLLLLGLLGGYPVGAQCITIAYKNKRLPKSDALRMLGFCSNGGPAFIFGMGSCLFPDINILWIIWAIHIVSALIVGYLLPYKNHNSCMLIQDKQISITKALERAIRILASVCGWVILFRILISFLQRWFLWMLPTEISILISGILELSNGCYRLTEISSPGVRFVLFSGILAFGGICVTMQTFSVTEDLGTGMYFPGKIMQCALSFLLSGIMQVIIFRPSEQMKHWYSYAIVTVILSLLPYILRYKKKGLAFLKEKMYNSHRISV